MAKGNCQFCLNLLVAQAVCISPHNATTSKNISYMFVVIGDCLQMILMTKYHSSRFLHQLATQFYTLDDVCRVLGSRRIVYSYFSRR